MRLLKNKSVIAIIIFFVIISFSSLFKVLMFTNTTKVCGKVTSKFKIRGVTDVKFEFKINNKFHSGSQEYGAFNSDISFDSLKLLDCVEIEYSNYWHIYSRITDKRLVE
jgi:hypothetical protein